jgi:uncharacterized protein
MIQPNELKLELPMEVAGGVLSTTTNVWRILFASYRGDLPLVKSLVDQCPALIYAQYNYSPPIHFAVREGHIELVEFFLDNGAHDPLRKLYPFLDVTETIAQDRGFTTIAKLLERYAQRPDLQKHKGDNGAIHFNRTALQNEFEKAVNANDLKRTEEILKQQPEFALDETYFWGEGILMMPAKENHREMIQLLIRYGARVPGILKWAQYYYFERYDGASFMMEKRMSPNTMSWQHVTLLHDMAQKGCIDKAELLIKYGADIDPVDEEYQSTPLGMACRWGHLEMVNYLLKQGADPNRGGASWATPLAWAKKKGQFEIEETLINAGAMFSP